MYTCIHVFIQKIYWSLRTGRQTRTERKADRQTDNNIPFTSFLSIDRQTDRQTDRHRQRERQTNRQTTTYHLLRFSA